MTTTYTIDGATDELLAAILDLPIKWGAIGPAWLGRPVGAEVTYGDLVFIVTPDDDGDPWFLGVYDADEWATGDAEALHEVAGTTATVVDAIGHHAAAWGDL